MHDQHDNVLAKVNAVVGEWRAFEEDIREDSGVHFAGAKMMRKFHRTFRRRPRVDGEPAAHGRLDGTRARRLQRPHSPKLAISKIASTTWTSSLTTR